MVKVATYNIHCGIGNDGAYDLARVAGVLRRSNCDIACLQEVEVNFESRKLRKWSTEHTDNQAELLARASGLGYFSFAGPLRAYMGEYTRSCTESQFDEVLVRDQDGKSGYGNAILSRFPIKTSRALVFEQMEPPSSEEYIFMDREEQPRGARAVLVDVSETEEVEEVGQEPAKQGCSGCFVPSKPTDRAHIFRWGSTSTGPTEAAKTSKLMWVVSAHLSHKMSSREQRSQAKQLVDWIDSLVKEYEGQENKPGVVLCGDLNSPSFAPLSSYSSILGDGRWTDTWKDKGTFCNQATFPSSCCGSSCGVKIDHILVLNHAGAAKVDCKAIRVLGDGDDQDASDHLAIVADLEVSGKS